MLDSRRPYSVVSLAQRWSCSDTTIRNLITAGKLASFRHGNLIRIPAAEVDRYEGSPVPAEAEIPVDSSPSAGESATRPSEPSQAFYSYSSKLPDWPGAMKRKTAAAYLDVSEAAFERDVAAGILPPSFILGGRPHWRREALDKAMELLGGDEGVPDHIKRFEERRGRR